MFAEISTCCAVDNLSSTVTAGTNMSVKSNMPPEHTPEPEYNCRNDPNSVLNLETFTKIDRATQCVLIPSFFLIGAPTNIVSMIVFYRQGLRDRMNLCLFCLAFVDLMYVTVNFIMVSYCFMDMSETYEGLYWRWTLLSRGLNFMYGSAYLSGCLTTIIAVERCVCVMFPMKAAALISTKTMAKLLAGTFVLIHGLCSVYAVKEKVISVKDLVTGQYITILTNTDLYLNHIILRIIEDIILSVISFFSFIVVLITTIITIVQLQFAMSWRKSTASGSSYLKNQMVLMKMLVMVSCVYILCTAPNVALALTRFTVPEFRADGAQCNLFISTHFLVLVIFMLNSSINFFVYNAMSSRFHHEVKAFFLCSTKAIQRIHNKSTNSEH